MKAVQGLLVAAILGVGALWFSNVRDDDNVVNVYCWYGYLDPAVLKDFEKETGIKVRLDIYDNNEILEAKLFAGNSGYDLVAPSLQPYATRQVKAGIYQKYRLDFLPNLVANLDHEIARHLKDVEGTEPYLIPFYWGTVGILYDEDELLKKMPNAPLKSHDLIFNPEVLKHFQACGVTLLEEATDVYPQVLHYLHLNKQDASFPELYKAQEQLKKIRPYIRRFSNSRVSNEIINGESCLAHAWSGEALLAVERAEALNRNVKYIIPEEGSTIWLDLFAIPKDAPHVENVHKLLNFLYRPDIAARITKYSMIAISNNKIKPLLDEEEKEKLFPSEEVMKKLQIEPKAPEKYDRERNRLWLQIKLGS